MKLENIYNFFNKNKTVDSSKLDEVLAGVDNKMFKVSLLNDQEKASINKLVNSGKNVDLDVVRNIIGRKRYREVHWDSVALNLAERDDVREKRRQELLNLGKDKEPFILDDGKINIVDVHGMHPSDNQAEINLGLPEELDRNIIQVDYNEQTSGDTEDPIKDESGVIKMIDSSGKIGGDYLRENFKLNDKSSFIMTGGNLRGCFLEALQGVIKEAVKVETSKVDFHVPLDKCYDDKVYDEITKYKDLSDAILKTIAAPSEVYEDGELVAATGTEKDLESKFRFYIWKEASSMINKMVTQFENKKNELDFETMIKNQKEEDEINLSRVRESLNDEITKN